MTVVNLSEITQDNWMAYRLDPKCEKIWKTLDRMFGETN